jgi:hypothetical protein
MANMYPARVLVAWLKEPDDIGYLGGDHRVTLTNDQALLYRHLIRDGNQTRTTLPKLVQGEVVSDLPPEYERHAEQVSGQPAARPFLDEGWEIKLLRLNTIVSLQPVISLAKCNSLMSAIHPTDFRSLAELALPLTSANYFRAGRVGDSYVLCNGYHRSHSLLRSGVTSIPALVGNVASAADLGMPPGTFAPHILDSERPPILTDFQHSRLAATVK